MRQCITGMEHTLLAGVGNIKRHYSVTDKKHLVRNAKIGVASVVPYRTIKSKNIARCVF